MQHVKAIHPLVAGQDIGGRIPLGMSYMQPGGWTDTGTYQARKIFGLVRSVSSVLKVLFSSQNDCHLGSICDGLLLAHTDLCVKFLFRP